MTSAFGAEVELVAGSGGVFDVLVDNRLEYSKHDTGQFPDEDELIARLETGRQPAGGQS